MIEKENLGTVIKLKTNEENMFEYLFMAHDPYINGFRHCFRPVIAVDGMHFKEKYWSVMFVSTTKDANE